jgi:hypothetical protein
MPCRRRKHPPDQHTHRQPPPAAHQRAGSPSVRHWDGAPPPQQLHQRIINAQLHALNIHAVHQELVAAVSKLRQRDFAECQAAEPLPPVCHYIVLPVTLPAAEV